MHLFKDRDARDWSIDINVDAIKRVRAALNVDLLEVVEGKLIDRLTTDPILLVDVLFVLCQSQANDKGITDEQFGRAMAGDAIESAMAAFFADLADFFPSGRRQLMNKAMAKVETLQRMALDHANSKLDGPELEESMRRLLTNSSGNSPASSESTQAH